MSKSFRGKRKPRLLTVGQWVILAGIAHFGDRATSRRIHARITRYSGHEFYALTKVRYDLTILIQRGLVQRPLRLREEPVVQLTKRGKEELARMNRLITAFTKKTR